MRKLLVVGAGDEKTGNIEQVTVNLVYKKWQPALSSLQHKLDKHKLNAAELALKAGHGEITSYLNYKNPHVFDPYDPKNVDLLRD